MIQEIRQKTKFKREKFKYQLRLIKDAMMPKTVILGDFNINYEKIYDDNYVHYVTSKKPINVLGVIFDSKLQWSDHISHSIKRLMNALNAIQIIKSFFTKPELLDLATSNFYSILYYNSEIWHLQTLKPSLKQKLLSAWAKALKSCVKNVDPMISFENIHIMCNRATPNQIMKYKLALFLFKLYNLNFNSVEFLSLNFNPVFTSRQSTFKILRNNNIRIGLNSLSNRLHLIKDIIPLDWLNILISLFKIKCKRLLP